MSWRLSRKFLPCCRIRKRSHSRRRKQRPACPAIAELRHVVHPVAGENVKTSRGLRALVDCAHGAATAEAPELFRACGVGATFLSAAPDGKNINDGCGALHPEAVAKAVAEKERAIRSGHNLRRRCRSRSVQRCGRARSERRCGDCCSRRATCRPAARCLAQSSSGPRCRIWGWKLLCARPAFACCGRTLATSMCWRRC